MPSGLRFDRVVLRVLGELRAALRESVPAGRTVLFTVTAPIRLPAQTVVGLEAAARKLLTRRSTERARSKGMIHGNAVRVRIIAGAFGRDCNVLGFVHNPEVDPDLLLDAAEALVRCFGTQR